MITITAEDFPPKNKRWIRPGANSLRTDDIEGAQPHLPGYQYMNKPNFHTVADIEKASPRPRHQSLNKPEYNLRTSDIPNANPSSVLFKTNRKDHNPLTPVYNLPSFEVMPATPPKFIRDTICIDDIDGAKPQIYSKWQTRNSGDIKDIIGATVRTKRELNKPDFMNPKDINTLEVFESKRKTNPLMPEYLCRDEDNKVIKIGHVEGSSPRQMVNLSQSPHSRHLNTKDIEGASSGTVGVGPIGTRLRNYIRSPNETQDIEGAQAGTFKKGISTVRVSNPLDPAYNWLTEEPGEVKPSAQTVTNDKYFGKNTSKFYGVTPSVSEASTRKPSQVATPETKNKDIARNANRFFGHDLSTPNTLQLEFNKNAEKFYESQGKVIPISYLPVGSIHRQKQQKSYVDIDSNSYQENSKKFFYANTPSSPGRLSASSEIRKASEGFYGVTPQPNRGRLPEDSQDYKFALSRSEIAKPGTGSQAGAVKKSNTGSSIHSSDRKSLSAVGKQFISN